MITVAILTVSDSTVAGTRADQSGPALRNTCEELGWAVVAQNTVPDEEEAIASQLRRWADSGVASVLLTTGGTGIALRDITPEATRSILTREIPGIPELIRAKGLEQTKFSILSRGVAGTRKRSLILNLPGSLKGAVHSLQIAAYLVPHIVDLLEGRTEHGTEPKVNTVMETQEDVRTS